jgi:hypothetical protein
MATPDLSPILIGIVVVVFNAGGVIYLAKNHFAHVNAALSRIDTRLSNLEQRISRLEGALSFPRNLTEN